MAGSIAKRTGAPLPPDRKALLRAYLLACVRDNVVSWGDLASTAVIDKLVRAVSTDAREVVGDLIRQGAGGGLRMLGELLTTRRRR